MLFGQDKKLDPVWDEFIQHAASKDLIKGLAFAADGAVTCSTPHFFNCTFSSAKVLREFELLPEGDVTNGNELLMGLDVPGGDKIPAFQLLEAFEVEVPKLPQPLQAIVQILKNSVDDVLPTFAVYAATPGTKNGSWIVALNQSSLEIATALTLTLNPFPSGEMDLGSAAQALQDLVGIKVDLSMLKFSSQNLPRVRLKHKAIITKSEGALELTSLFEIAVGLPVAGFIINLKAGTNGLLSASLLNDGGSIGSVLGMLVGAPAESDAVPKGQDGIFLEDTINLWKVSVDLPGDSLFSTGKVTFSIGFILMIPLPGLNIKIGLSYDSKTETFTGSLLTKELFFGRLGINYNDLEDLGPGMLAQLVDFYDIKDSLQLRNLPDSVPTRLATAVITYTKGSADIPYKLSFSAEMKSKSISSAPNEVPFPFDWSGISLDYFRQGSPQPVNSLVLSSMFQLNSQSGKFRAGHIDVSFSYESVGAAKAWTLAGSARFIQLGAILEFFDPSLQNEVADVLGKLSIDQLDMAYTYMGNQASSFLFSGLISFGDIKLMLYYQYATKTILTDSNAKTAADQQVGSNPNLKPLKAAEVPANAESAWRFDAYLDAGSVGSNIGTIVDAITDNASDRIPSFIRDIDVAPSDPSAHLITLHAGKSSKTGPSGPFDRIVFLFKVELFDIEFTIEQISTKTNTGSSTKRLLRVSAGNLPLLSNLPVVKELPQPWQKLQYMWSPESGLTRDEVALLNETLQIEAPSNKIYFKPATRAAVDATDPSAAGIDPVVLVAGHHFVVVANDQAILDHVFSPDTSKKVANRDLVSNADAPGSAVSAIDTGSQEEETPPSKGALKKNSQFLDISGVSLQFNKGSLWIFVDATVRLGPIELSLIDFGIGFDISNLKINKLDDILDRIQFQLAGMAVLFDKPPILISGAFYHDVAEAGGKRVESYRGGIAVGIPPYKFVAVGEYAIVEIVVPEKKEFKSVFIFAKLDGPIVDFAFASIRGLRIGFGYNSIIRAPALEELFMFPLIASDATAAGSNPMAILDAMRGGSNPFVQLKDESFWLAFGFSISCFDIITATACAVVSFSDAGPIFAIYGNLVCAFPPETSSPEAHLFYIEVLMSAELNFVEDCFKVQAALAPTSFVFVPFCRLEGGMALYTFFGKNPHAGDWVFTVGGYHRAFQVPAHYPKAARLAVNFNVSIIRIRGECYFAITPKAIMTGALIKAELDIGPVYAWLTAAFDAIVQFSPLHYSVSMSVEVGVECNVPLLFCTIHIRIHIGARLEIQGPRFGGTAYVDFWFFSFSFDFGARALGPPPIPLDEFYELCEKAGPPDMSPQANPQAGLHARLKFSIEDGVFNMPSEDKKPGEGPEQPEDTGAGSKWYVKGGSFRFRVSSVFALTGAFLETEESAKANQSGKTVMLGDQKTGDMDAVILPSPAPSKLHSLPMQVHAEPEVLQPDAIPQKDGITSRLCIAVQDADVIGRTIEDFKPSFVYKPMPLTLWADPKSPPDRLSKDKGTVDLPMCVVIEAPDPVLAVSKVPQFNATDMAKLCAGSNIIPGIPIEIQDTLLPEELGDVTKTPLEQWDAMTATWKASSEANLGLANDLTRLCMEALEWNKPPPEIEEKAAKAGIKPWEVPVTFPTRLVTGTHREEVGVEDGLDSFYLELPRITVTIA